MDVVRAVSLREGNADLSLSLSLELGARASAQARVLTSRVTRQATRRFCEAESSGGSADFTAITRVRGSVHETDMSLSAKNEEEMVAIRARDKLSGKDLILSVPSSSSEACALELC